MRGYCFRIGNSCTLPAELMRQSLEIRLQKLESIHHRENIVVAVVHIGETEEQALERMGIDLASVDRCIYIIEPERCTKDNG